MIKTIWVEAYAKKKGKWEEYEEATGEVKKGFFGGETFATVKKKRWIELEEYSDHLVDGALLSLDTEKVLNQLDSDGFDILNITPVISGRYSWTEYGRGGHSAATCASWGYSVTDGVIVSAKKKQLS